MGAKKKHVPGCGCCPSSPCGGTWTIGFDAAKWTPFWDLFTGSTARENIKDTIGDLTGCRAVFSGFPCNGSCGSNSVLWAAGDWAAVKTYIEGGGRLYVGGEFAGVSPCIGDRTTLNSFLSALGSAISMNNDSVDLLCHALPGTERRMQVGTANIASGLTEHKMSAAATLAGGTKVFGTPTSNSPMVVVEALGSGFLFVSSDSNMIARQTVCPYGTDNDTFFCRILSYDDADII